MLTCNGGVSWPHQLRVRSYGQPWWPAVYEEPFLQWTYGRSALYEPLRQITWRTKCLVNNSLLFILIVQCSKFVKRLLHYQVAVIIFATEHRHICPNISSLVNWKINIVFVLHLILVQTRRAPAAPITTLNRFAFLTSPIISMFHKYWPIRRLFRVVGGGTNCSIPASWREVMAADPIESSNVGRERAGRKLQHYLSQQTSCLFAISSKSLVRDSNVK